MNYTNLSVLILYQRKEMLCVGQDTSLCLTGDLTSIKASLAGKISEDDAVTSFADINHTHIGYAASYYTHSGYADADHTHTIAKRYWFAERTRWQSFV